MRKPSVQTLIILEQLLRLPEDEWTYGYRLSLELGVNAGTLYPILIRLKDRGLVEDEWEKLDSLSSGSPRHMYRLTAKGRHFAASTSGYD